MTKGELADGPGPFPPGDRVAASRHGVQHELHAVLHDLDDDAPPPVVRLTAHEGRDLLWLGLSFAAMLALFGWLLFS